MSFNNPSLKQGLKNNNTSSKSSQPDSLWKTSKRSDRDQLQNSIQQQSSLKKELALYNGLADGKIEAFSSIINLFLLLLIETLGGSVYNGPETNAPYILGWISVSQVILAYILVIVVKFCVIPKIQRKLRQKQDFIKIIMLNEELNQDRRQFEDLEPAQLYLLSKPMNNFVHKHTQSNSLQMSYHESVLHSSSNFVYSNNISPNHQPHRKLQQIIQKQRNAQWWKNFLQVFIVGKTFSVPGVALLLLIITPLTVATIPRTSVQAHNAQGWVAVGVWAFFILVFIAIRFCFWNLINKRTENLKSEPFILFHLVCNKKKELLSYNLRQLEDLQGVIQNRTSQFSECFAKVDSSQVLGNVEKLINQKLPKKNQKVQQNVKNIIALQQSKRNVYSGWLNFYNARIVSTIINILKFLIVMAITFVPNYSKTPESLLSGKQALGSIGIICFVFGYVFYFSVKCCLLPNLQRKVHQNKADGFIIYKLVYFGNKNLSDLEVHELENILQALNQRRQQFQECFPDANIDTLTADSQKIIQSKINACGKYEPVYESLQKYIKAHNTVKFLRSYQETPLMQSVYSTYVLLVLLILTIAAPSSQALYILGYFGVAVFAFLITIQLIFRCLVVPHYQKNQQYLKISGWSGYFLVYNKQMKLESLELGDLRKIETIISENSVEFKKCFPKANSESTLKQVRQIISKKLQSPLIKRSVKNEQDIHMLQLEVQRTQKKLKGWSGLMNDTLYPLTPVLIVIFIFWAQTIGSSRYGRTVCGFLTIGILSVVISLIFFYNFWYKGHLKNQIREIKQQIKEVQKKSNNMFNKQTIVSAK